MVPSVLKAYFRGNGHYKRTVQLEMNVCMSFFKRKGNAFWNLLRPYSDGSSRQVWYTGMKDSISDASYLLLGDIPIST